MSETFTDTVAAVAVAGTEEALQTSETAVEVAQVSAVIAADSAVASVEATETAAVAAVIAEQSAETAAEAQQTAEAAIGGAVAAGEVAYATAQEVQTLKDEFTAFRESMQQRKQREAEEEIPEDGEPEVIPVTNEFHREGGETANERTRRRNSVARRRAGRTKS